MGTCGSNNLINLRYTILCLILTVTLPVYEQTPQPILRLLGVRTVFSPITVITTEPPLKDVMQWLIGL